MIWLLNYWQPIAASILTAFIAFGFHSCSMDRAEQRQVEAVAMQKLETETQCLQQQKVTTDASNLYQNGLSSLDRDLSSVMQSDTCVKLSTGSTASGPDGSSRGVEQSFRDEIPVNELYEFAGKKCEKDRLKLLALQKFTIDERSGK